MSNVVIVNKKNRKSKYKDNTQSLSLLFSDENLEIMVQEIKKNIFFDIRPSIDDNPLIEFFYMLEGEIEYRPKEEPILIRKGDLFYTKNISEICLFKPLTDVKLLYISSAPVFSEIKTFDKGLEKIKGKVKKLDEYTFNHCLRVRDLSIRIAKKMNLDIKNIILTAYSGLYHDIGKAKIPDEILLKPGHLSDEEFYLIKEHPQYGSDYVKDVNQFDISKIIEQHHERYDGSGYPKGLKGEEICIEARIVAVADTFDAMTSDRTYQTTYTASEAIKEINKLSGTKYDKKVVKAFNSIIDEFDY